MFGCLLRARRSDRDTRNTRAIPVALQAINRIHRVGQRRETTVHRYIVRRTVEERIVALRAMRRNAERAPAASLQSPPRGAKGGGGGAAGEEVSLDDLDALFGDGDVDVGGDDNANVNDNDNGRHVAAE